MLSSSSLHKIFQSFKILSNFTQRLFLIYFFKFNFKIEQYLLVKHFLKPLIKISIKK